MDTSNPKTLDATTQSQESQETDPQPAEAAPAKLGPDTRQSPPEGHTVSPAASKTPQAGEYPQPNASERVDYENIPPKGNTFPTTGEHLTMTAKTEANKKGASSIVVAVSSVITTVVAITLFYGSITLSNPVASGLALLLSSILLFISVVLLIWGAALGGREILVGDGDKTKHVIAIVSAVIFAPIAMFFGAIGMIAAIGSWFAGFF